jgi:hypothetical protein
MKWLFLLLALLLTVAVSSARAATAVRGTSYNNSSQTNVASPAGTTNTTGLMMGLAGALTPVFSGNVLVVISGDIFNATAIADGGKVQMRTGTGGVPANAGALTGNTCGGFVNYIAATTAEKAPFTVNCVVTGLTIGTAIWIDVALAAITGGTATIENVSISAFEL